MICQYPYFTKKMIEIYLNEILKNYLMHYNYRLTIFNVLQHLLSFYAGYSKYLQFNFILIDHRNFDLNRPLNSQLLHYSYFHCNHNHHQVDLLYLFLLIYFYSVFYFLFLYVINIYFLKNQLCYSLKNFFLAD